MRRTPVALWTIGLLYLYFICIVFCNSVRMSHWNKRLLTYLLRPTYQRTSKSQIQLLVLEVATPTLPASFQAAATMLLPGEVTATAWLPTCDVISARHDVMFIKWYIRCHKVSSKNATIGGGGRFDPLLGWRGCRKSLGIGGLSLMKLLLKSCSTKACYYDC